MGRRVSIFVKILGTSAAIFAFAVIISALTFLERSASGDRLVAQTLRTELLRIHENQKLFILRREVQFSDSARAGVRRLRALVAEDPDTYMTVVGATESYAALLDTLTTKILLRGINENTGAEGAFRTSVHELQSLVEKSNQQVLEIRLLEARRREKDFFLRGDTSYIRQVQEHMEQFLSSIEFTGLSSEERISARLLCQSYLHDFRRAATVIAEIQQVDGRLDAEVASIDPVLRNVINSRQKTVSLLQYSTTGVMIVGFVAGLVATVILSRRISKPLLSVSYAAQKVSRGDYGTRVSVDTGDELEDLARAFNEMVENVKSRTEELHRKNKELEDANHYIQRQNSILEEQATTIEINNTELLEVNSQLAQKNDQLQEAITQLDLLNKEKNEFVGIVSHDLKNPIQNIRMIAGLFAKGQVAGADDMAELGGDLLTITARMQELIDNLLDINKIESGNLRMNIDRVEACSVVTAVVGQYAQRAADKNIAIQSVNLHGDFTVLADRALMYQIYDNIVSNAVKYTPPGKKVSLSVERQEGSIVFAVSDQGPGLTEEDRKKLFGKFARLSAQPTGGEGSTGLGLSIVKRLTEAMGGKVWCESIVGEGSTFFVALPTADRTA